MNQLDLKTTTQSIVAILIGDSALFTAFDVTKLLRDNGQTVVHGQVKSIVHDIMAQTPGYNRALKLVGGPIPAWVYYPHHTNVSDYDASETSVVYSHEVADLFKSQPVTVQSVPSAPGVVVAAVLGVSAASKIKDSVALDKFHRLRVPASVTRAAGIHPHQKAFVQVDAPSGKVTITSTQPVGAAARVYMVDEYGNIRIKLSDQIQVPIFGFTVTPNGKIEAKAEGVGTVAVQDDQLTATA